ncbi:uncharacterized protein LOC129593848 isoform X3 [Paramacrobiotus metropolitanus]|uniref:uncharacterized protein LOC129593848 isoform X3 n=1 Tax=Paramacrobiotus metropolitanus TaxID=2943436 RepID=UPI0024463A75|nr:uncharacterized protein LOC129593848 isoform X3 [Paramacrobiotus metropolitanus]
MNDSSMGWRKAKPCDYPNHMNPRTMRKTDKNLEFRIRRNSDYVRSNPQGLMKDCPPSTHAARLQSTTDPSSVRLPTKNPAEKARPKMLTFSSRRKWRCALEYCKFPGATWIC